MDHALVASDINAAVVEGFEPNVDLRELLVPELLGIAGGEHITNNL